MNSEAFRYPRSYHTPHADAQYEQCEWDQRHVEAIYRNLAARISADGQWHDIPTGPGAVGRYRVVGERYFQAVYADAANPVFEALMAMDPVETEDDAEWEIWQESEGAYAITSTFALTPGPFEHQPVVDEWLWRHGLGLKPEEHFVQGIAYFTEIDAGCVRDAMERLTWLENAFVDLNERLNQAGREFWHDLAAESDTMMEKLGASLDRDELAPLPQCYQRDGTAKRREPFP
jgi:hypothetical protein